MLDLSIPKKSTCRRDIIPGSPPSDHEPTAYRKYAFSPDKSTGSPQIQHGFEDDRKPVFLPNGSLLSQAVKPGHTSDFQPGATSDLQPEATPDLQPGHTSDREYFDEVRYRTQPACPMVVASLLCAIRGQIKSQHHHIAFTNPDV